LSAGGAILSLAFSFAILLAGALLFTNGIEWLGARLELGQGAVGGVLAAVATALPETLIPIVAIVGGTAGSEEVAIGAILGAPFLLSTLAMVLVGSAVLAYRGRRPQGVGLEVHHATLARDLGFFIVCFAGAFALGLLSAPLWLRIAAAIVLVASYMGYVRRTLADSGDIEAEEALRPLTFDPTKDDPPSLFAVVAQCVVALGAIVGGADLFVEAVTEVAEDAGVQPLVLSLVIAPFATELPEKINSFFWARQGKDALALGNITGAMVFQSTIPVAFGLAFTDWAFDGYSILACSLALAGAALAIFELRVRRRFVGRAVAVWAVLYATFAVYVVANA
jgi:cation:H+ antiporter